MANEYFTTAPGCPLKPLTIAVFVALSGIAQADTDDEVARLINPDSSVAFGLGYVGQGNPRFGMYNGLFRDGSVGLLDFTFNRRDDDSGTWLRASGRNLGLDTREARVEHERQGQWGYFLEYNQIPRVTPYSVVTGVQGIGSDRQSVPATAAATGQFTLRTERQRTSFGLSSALPGDLQVRILLQNEDKDGSRLFGRGTPSFMEFLAEPIRSNTRQVDVVLDYTGSALQLSGGYYGSFYRNDNKVLLVNGGNNAFNAGVATTGVPFDHIALPPDNQAHQFHLAGGYQFAKTTRVSFKLAKSYAIQNDDFISTRFYNVANDGVSANTSGRTDLGGRVETTLANLSLTARPTSALSLLANLRYEDRDDQTAVARYITAVGGTGAAPVLNPLAATATTDGYNEPRSLTHSSGKLEASYALPAGFRATAGIDHDIKERTMNGVRIVGYRHQVEETSYRGEIQRTMSETLNGSLAYVYSDRSGSGYRNLVTLGGTTCYPTAAFYAGTRCGLLQPIYMADRERHKLRWLTDWSPTEQINAQLMIEGAQDQYGAGRGTPDIGVRQGDYRLYSIDVSYAPSDRVKLNTWVSHMETSIDQATMASPGSNTGVLYWSSSQKNAVDSVGAGVRGKLPYRVEVGLDYLFAWDKTDYATRRDGATPASSTAVFPAALPAITYRQHTVKAFAMHPIDHNLTLRLDYIADRRAIDDWTWQNWQYSDGTRVLASPRSTVHFVGVSVLYAFR